MPVLRPDVLVCLPAVGLQIVPLVTQEPHCLALTLDWPACADIAALGFKGCHLPAQVSTSAVTYRRTDIQHWAKSIICVLLRTILPRKALSEGQCRHTLH